jgi:hypothetical protein
MRHLAAKLALILLVVGATQYMAVLMLPAFPLHDAEEKCSCPMCRTGEAGHHCSCCAKGKICTCKMSSEDPAPSLPQALKFGLLNVLSECRVAPRSERLFLTVVFSAYTTYLQVLTPPPKTWL